MFNFMFKKPFCSYYVSEVYNSNGMKLKSYESDCFKSRGDIACRRV
jgi:hypothetical protein